MKKKVICVFIAIFICFRLLPVHAFAKEQVHQYTDEEKEQIFLNYTGNEYMLDALFSNDSGLGYWNLVNKVSKNDTLNWSIDAASRMIGEYPDEKDYVEILTNLLMMQSGEIAEQIQMQHSVDDLKDGTDYAFDILDIAASFVGGSDLLKDISPIIDASMGGKDVFIHNIEQAKYYESTIRDYSQANHFLSAVSQYAASKELRAAASSLLRANDTLLQKRLDYLVDATDSLVDYQSEFFINNLNFELLKNTDLYASDDTVKWYVDCGARLAESILSIKSAGEFAFKMSMLAGNIGFGTSNTFNRYQEMKVVADIAGALVEANRKIYIPHDRYVDSTLVDIQKKTENYKMLLTVHARGEYLLYQLVGKDGGLLSEFQAIFDAFKSPEDTAQGWYAKQVDCLTEYYNIIEAVFADFTSEEEKDSVSNNVFSFLPSRYDLYCCGHDGDSAFHLNPDGTFTSVNEWWDWGSQGDGYPNGTCDISILNGRFSNLTQIDEYTYQMSLDYVEQSDQVGREYIENSVRYIVSEDRRLSQAKEFYIYLPGTDYDIDYMSGQVSVNGKILFTLPPWDLDWDNLFANGYVLYIDTMPALISDKMPD